MAYGQKSKLQGDTRTFELSPEIKRYSLRDVGFAESKGGKFTLERSLDPNSPYNQGFKFKMTVTSALDGFKMVTTTANGIKEVNVFKGNDAETHIEQLNYILKDLMDHNIIVEE
ncbi:DUF1831 domain-containing protein [Ligilactobacillus ruminis]|jgi:hypothetical protein|uniref:Cysteine desulfurase n=1 Tax=Ligilactobacillus ruminis TaxID=1623 RepID=A0A8B2Z3W7_9LACO|nr:DUF1831 domain-containing protein [Ligilactobacillus ruminis]RGK47679.1 cysteine desulfurase [Ligilactobacillus ruminis]